MFRLGIVLLLGLLASQASADSLEFPLHGYFHPGRAMPVQWDMAHPGAKIQLSADNAITSAVSTGDNSQGVFPWLVINSNAQNVNASLPIALNESLHPLDESERLIASTDMDLTGASVMDLFPGHKINLVQLDSANPIPGPPMAWETLDALILTPEEFSRIPIATRQSLLAAGVTLAVGSVNPPDKQLPWEKFGLFGWVTSGRTTIPSSINPDAFDPILGWPAGRTSAFRWRTVELAIIFSLLAGGVALWKSRPMPVAMAALCILAMGALAWDNQSQSPIARASGTIYANDDAISVADQWLYQISHREAHFDVPVTGMVQPIASDQSELNARDMTLVCNDNGDPVSITGKLHADCNLALLIRQIAQSPKPQTSQIDSPLRKLIQESIYPQCTIVGQSPAHEGADWPCIMVQATTTSKDR
jgi:hypothetical protein